ncbi:MAG TPA: 50S ribosomal protein L11 methyltransferase [Caulobacteraceae bacterium]|jgi:ribosomal protein L11 methyltransferase|nr:50S ribosomal protein L11 methyltransferase [Caulobacteraceae bacterium]
MNTVSQGALQIVARGLRAAVEAAATELDEDPRLQGLAYSMLEEDEAAGRWRIDAWPLDDGEADLAETALRSHDLTVARELLADADWLAMALSGLPPVRAGRFFVFGMHDRGRVPQGKVALRIEAGAAFGTGHHGTTVGCLLALDLLLKRRSFARVLDVGTGTGVLAIAAARTGSRHIVGTDIDPVSVRIARENARVNRAACRFTHADGLRNAIVRRAAPFDLVFANILARPLVRLAPQIASAVAEGGVVVLSGLLRSQARTVRAAYASQGLSLERRIGRDAWATLVLMRRRPIG